MNGRLSLPTFVAGPEPEGRGAGILTHSGLPGGAGWQGSLPLVLLEWAKLRSAEPFSGRFAVAGGAIAIKAAYFGEGSAGSIARAFGVFIDDETLPLVLNCEQCLFAAIPEPSLSDDFGLRPLELSLVPDQPVPGLSAAGLAWRDRHITVDTPQLLEKVALDVLASIDPPGQRTRITGWCTTAHLSARGDFLPIQSCNLLVTRPAEPAVHDRLLAGRISVFGIFEGEAVGAPGLYQFWLRLTKMAGALPSGVQADMVWHSAMAGWTEEELAWRFVELLSQHRTPYAEIVGAIVAIGDSAGQNRPQVAAATMRNYLLAVSGHDRLMVPDVIGLFRRAGAERVHLQATLDEVSLALLDEQLLAKSDDATLLRMTALLRHQVEAGRTDNAHAILEMLDDQSVWRALGGNIRSPGSAEGERRIHLSMIRQRLGSGAAIPTHKVFLRRKVVEHMIQTGGPNLS